jgi:hypothetical protein
MAAIVRRHTGERTIREFELLDQLVASLSDGDWARPLIRPESKDPWTVNDALAYITYWKDGVALSARGQHRPSEERGLHLNDRNHFVYMRWLDRSPQEVLTWHRQVHEDLLTALRAAPEKWFNGRKRSEDWPGDLDHHSAFHRIKDIEQAFIVKAMD